MCAAVGNSLFDWWALLSLTLQKGIQCFLIVVAMLCVPWMLLFKPLILRHQYLRKKHLVSVCLWLKVTRL
jgi:hypothetical protein